MPVRQFRWSRGLGYFPGWWWAATTDSHVGYESWLERDHVRLLISIRRSPVSRRSRSGCTGRVTGVGVARPGLLRPPAGRCVVIDVRADDRIEAADAEAFAVTAAACARLGWEFRRAGEIDQVLGGNVRWLARYRHPRCLSRAGVAGCGRLSRARRHCWRGRPRPGIRWNVAGAVSHDVARSWWPMCRERLGPATAVCSHAKEVITGERGPPPRSRGSVTGSGWLARCTP